MTNLSLEAQDAIIRKRLEVDERPLKKLAKKLVQLAKSSAFDEISRLELITEFDNYDHTLRRLTLSMKANHQEVVRYQTEAATIRNLHIQTEKDVDSLRQVLLQEQQAMADRASYDEVALEFRQHVPKSRKSLTTAITKLEEEVSELENEKTSYGETWQLRKSGFEDIMARLLDLQREISGEKANAELRDAAEDSDDEEGAVPAVESNSASFSEPMEAEEVAQVTGPIESADTADTMDTT